MTRFSWLRRWLFLLLPLGFFSLQGCNTVLETYQFTVQGTLSVSQGNPVGGLIILDFFRAETGEGILKQPLLRFAQSKVFKLGDFQVPVEYPMGMGKGLVIYAWFDANSDSKLCTPNAQNEYSTLVEIKDFPRRVIKVNLTMDQRCLGPEALYPPKK